jgi:ketosteroid isomerase-like protein
VSAANLTLVRELHDAFAPRDPAAALVRLHPDLEFRQTKLAPRGGHYRAREFFGRVLGAIDFTVTVERFIDAGDHVAAGGGRAGAPAQAASRSTWRRPPTTGAKPFCRPAAGSG